MRYCFFYPLKPFAHFKYPCGIFLLLWNKDETSQDQQSPRGQEMEQEDGLLASTEHRKTLDGVIQGRHRWTEGVKADSVKKCVRETFVLTSCKIP